MASDAGSDLAAAEQAIRGGAPKAALAALTAAVKAQPAKVELRIFLAQVLCVLGQWDRAHTQLNVAADMEAATIPMREMVGHSIRCEKVRAAVFAGRRSPMIFGEPENWLAVLIESLLQAGRGESTLSQRLASEAFDAAPACRGRINGTPFEWIADADSRLGPVLEAMVNGRYYWIPFARIANVDIEPPTDLRDVVWLPAQLHFANGGEQIAMLPVRYPGSEASHDEQLAMARRTEWRQAAPASDQWFGLGQRVLVTDLGEHDFLAISSIELEHASGQTAGASPAAQHA